MDMSLLQTKMKPATPLPELQTVEDIYRWIDENIAYGWQDKDGGTHTSEMKDFRRLYRTMSVTETLRQKIGTCIEQVALMHELRKSGGRGAYALLSFVFPKWKNISHGASECRTKGNL